MKYLYATTNVHVVVVESTTSKVVSILGTLLFVIFASTITTEALLISKRISVIIKHNHRYNFHTTTTTTQHHSDYSISPLSTTITHASISTDETSPSFTNHQQQRKPESTTTSTTTTDNNDDNDNKKPTLYEILGASPTATRSELKQKYVALAKITHPDAKQRRGKGDSSSNSDSTTNPIVTKYDFNDIATAYKILSDTKQRRRYDRSIQAELLTEQIASAVQNHPITELTIKAIGTIAVPFFRTINKVTTTTTTASSTSTRTTTSTNASSSKNASSAKSSTPTTALDREEPWQSPPSQQQVQANMASVSSNYVTIPVREEYRSSSHSSDDSRTTADIEREVQEEYHRLLQVQHMLQEVTQQRLRMALYTPQSGLNSIEACNILNSLSTIDGGNGPSWAERLNFLRSSVETEINALQNTEQIFIQQQQMNTRAQSIHQNTIHDQFMIRQQLMQAERNEHEARRALERAIEETKQQRYQYEHISEELFAAENAAVHASNELERVQQQILKQSENVRLALIRKERALYNNQNNQGSKAPEEQVDDDRNEKPEPPMSPQHPSFSSAASSSRYTTFSQNRSSPSNKNNNNDNNNFLESSESSMLDAWPKQSMSTTTFPQQPTVYKNLQNPMSDMGFDSNRSYVPSINNNNELMRLRQQEYELSRTIHEIESHINHLMEQRNR